MPKRPKAKDLAAFVREMSFDQRIRAAAVLFVLLLATVWSMRRVPSKVSCHGEARGTISWMLADFRVIRGWETLDFPVRVQGVPNGVLPTLIIRPWGNVRVLGTLFSRSYNGVSKSQLKNELNGSVLQIDSGEDITLHFPASGIGFFQALSSNILGVAQAPSKPKGSDSASTILTDIQGRDRKPFSLRFERGDHEEQINGIFGLHPTVRLSYPPQYVPLPGHSFLSFDLSDSDQEPFELTRALRGIPVSDSAVFYFSRKPLFEARIPVKSVAFQDMSGFRCTFSGGEDQILPTDALEIDFEGSSRSEASSSLHLDTTKGVVSVNGNATSLRINGAAGLPMRIETWRWYTQMFIGAVLGILLPWVWKGLVA